MMGIVSKISRLLKMSAAEKLSLEEEIGKFEVDGFLIASSDGLLVYSTISDGESVAAGTVQLLSVLNSFFGEKDFYGVELPRAFWYFVPVEDIVVVLRSRRKILEVELKEIKGIVLKQLGI